MKLFAKYPWLWSVAIDDDGHVLLNGYSLAEVAFHRGLVNWQDEAKTVFAEALTEMRSIGCVAGAEIWRDEMAVAA